MASITITTSGAQDARLGPAFGAKLGLSGNASAAQVKAHLVEYLRQVVYQYEQDEAIRANPSSAFDPT